MPLLAFLFKEHFLLARLKASMFVLQILPEGNSQIVLDWFMSAVGVIQKSKAKQYIAEFPQACRLNR